MKKSFVAMALIMVLCMAQFLIGNAAGKAVEISDTVVIPEWDISGAYTAEKVDGGLKITGTAAKGEYSCVMGAISGNAKEYAKMLITVEGKAGTTLKLKLEAGTDAAVIETGWDQTIKDPVLVDGEQVIEWPLDAAWLTSNGGQNLVIFVNPGVAGASEPVIIKSIKLCTSDYAEEEPTTEAPTEEPTTEAPTEAPTQAPSNTDNGGKFPVVPVVAAVVVVAVLAVVLAKKKKAA